MSIQSLQFMVKTEFFNKSNNSMIADKSPVWLTNFNFNLSGIKGKQKGKAM